MEGESGSFMDFEVCAFTWELYIWRAYEVAFYTF